MPPRPRSAGPYARQAKSTGLWTAQYRAVPGGPKLYTDPYKTKREAQRAALLEEENARARPHHDPRSGRTLYRDWHARWWAARIVEDSTLRSDVGRVNNVVLPRWGAVPVEDILHLDVQAWVLSMVREPQGARARPYAASTARHCLHLVSSCLKAAVVEGLIWTNPCTGVRKPDLPIPEDRYLTDHEVDLVFPSLDGPPHVFCDLMLDTGLRPGEVAGLHQHRCHVDGNDPYVSVVEAFDFADRVMRPHPKGKKRRDVPMSTAMAERLVWHWATAAPDMGSCGMPHEAGEPCRHNLAVPNRDGTPLDRSNLSNRDWARAISLVPATEVRLAREERGWTIGELAEHSGIPAANVLAMEATPDEAHPGLNRVRRILDLPKRGTSVFAVPYDLRHTAASRWLTAGVSLERLQQLMGHESWTTTQRYARWMDDGRQAVRDAMATRPRITAPRESTMGREATPQPREAAGEAAPARPTTTEHDRRRRKPRQEQDEHDPAR